MARLGDLVEQIRGVSYKPEDIHDSLNKNSIILLRANNIKDGRLNFDEVIYVDRKRVNSNQMLKAGDVLICSSSGSKELVGKAAYVQKDLPMTFGAFCKVVRSKELCPEYLGHFFNSPNYRKRISDLSAGANINNIRNEHIDELEILVPAVDRQRYVISVLDKIGALILIRRQQLAKLDELVKARFVEMFGDPQYNTKLLPCYTLGELGTWNSGGTPSRANAKYFGGNIDWYSAGELNSLFLVESVEKITKDAIENSSAKIFSKGSLLIGMYDTAAFKMGILKKDSASNQACACIEPNEKINVIWLYYELTLMKDFFLCQRRGVRQKNLNLSMIKEFLIPVSDLKGQDDFAAFVEQEVALKLTIQQSLDKLEVLKKSLMQEYFG